MLQESFISIEWVVSATLKKKKKGEQLIRLLSGEFGSIQFMLNNLHYIKYLNLGHYLALFLILQASYRSISQKVIKIASKIN